MGKPKLTSEQRFYIEKELGEGLSRRKIAKKLNVSPSTISREINRNTLDSFNGVYCWKVADNTAKERRANAKTEQAFRGITDFVDDFICKRLEVHTSPDVISGELNLKHDIQISESTIYLYIQQDREQGGELYKQLPHRGKPYKTKTSSGERVNIKNRVGIEKRPAIVDEKTELGHFEIDTIFGAEQKSFLLTLVDKMSKSVIIRKLDNKQAETVVEAFKDIDSSTFYDFKTLTSDNGSEFAAHENISEVTGADFFFARPYHSWERGLNEHTNGLIRRFYPKGTDFNEVSDEDIAKLEHILNTRGRASLGYRSPNDVFLEHLMAA